jgi:hypothetical protein
VSYALNSNGSTRRILEIEHIAGRIARSPLFTTQMRRERPAPVADPPTTVTKSGGSEAARTAEAADRRRHGI